MTPEASSRASFELRRRSAAAVSAELAVIELEGHFRASRGRFTRQPLLIVERPGAPRAELAPVTARHDGDRWRGLYAVALDALEGGTFALGVRGVVYDLPAPDRVDDGDRLAAVAREANALRRHVEVLEAERDAAQADRDAAVDAARQETAERIEALEREVAAAHESLVAAGVERETTMAELEARVAQEHERAEAAEARAAAAEERAALEVAGADVLRTELAEERERAQAAIAEGQERLEAARRTAELETTVAPPRRTPEPDHPTEAMDVDQADDLDDDDSRPIPLRREAPTRVRSAAAAAEPVHHHGPGLSPWIAVVALGLFAFLVVALVLGLS